ncbi:MAG: 2Fe-2S iron-sulfur cluster binding domain-containing protein, partial [Methylobacteriaceae bacterium]|nr:2Fe-2S iron-sulfur cluster binding domain-containing protein [Methylobacteriaceae bacterium]
MSVTSASPGVGAPRRDLSGALRVRSRIWQRNLRLWSGVILFMFLTMHLLNHALAIFGLGVMERVQHWRIVVWQSLPGTILLYGCFVVHAGFALKRMLGRRTWRMPLDEAAQIGLGIIIPLLLVNHIIGTRYMAEFFQGDESYSGVLRVLWWSRPILQTLLVVCAWTHGVIGIDHTLRSKPWFTPWRTPGLVLAVLVPALALAGFVAGSREALQLHGPPQALTPQQAEGDLFAKQWTEVGLAGVGVVLVAALALLEFRRRRSGSVVVRYTGHGAVRIPRGLSVLEASRIHRIPHRARCGGRARCSTCRILITDGLDSLPEPVRPELTMLERISAPRNVRLGCQVRPQSDVSVQILLPTLAREGGPGDKDDDALSWGEEENVTILVVDMRAFNTLVRRQLPNDLVILLNRFIAEMTQTVKAHDGRVETLVTDGLTA